MQAHVSRCMFHAAVVERDRLHMGGALELLDDITIPCFTCPLCTGIRPGRSAKCAICLLYFHEDCALEVWKALQTKLDEVTTMPDGLVARCRQARVPADFDEGVVCPLCAETFFK